MKSSLLPSVFAAVCGSTFFLPAPAPAQDTIFLTSGERMPGKIMAVDARNVRIQRALAPPVGAPATSAPVLAIVTLARTDIERAEFAPDPAIEPALADHTPGALPALESLWQRFQSQLNFPKSPAPGIALALLDALLARQQPADAARALALATQIEKSAWDPEARAAAKQGRLRALIASNRAGEAVREAADLAKISDDPSVLVQAKFILGQASAQALRQLVADNPRWEEDRFVIPERHRLYHDALENFLYASLFHGDNPSAARGLWSALEVYQFTNETPAAVEIARDIVALYPEVPEAARARRFLEQLPPEAKASDNEKAARADLAPSSTPAQ